jgi:hypothetical protein
MSRVFFCISYFASRVNIFESLLLGDFSRPFCILLQPRKSTRSLHFLLFCSKSWCNVPHKGLFSWCHLKILVKELFSMLDKACPGDWVEINLDEIWLACKVFDSSLCEL